MNYFTEEEADDIQCPSGMVFDATTEQCTLCPDNTYSENGESCTECPTGTLAPAGSVSVTDCEDIGSIKDDDLSCQYLLDTK